MTQEDTFLNELTKTGVVGDCYKRNYPDAPTKVNAGEVWDLKVVEVGGENGEVLLKTVMFNPDRMEANGFRKIEGGWVNP